MERRKKIRTRQVAYWLAGPADNPIQQLQLVLLLIAALYLAFTAVFNLQLGIGYRFYSYGMLALACLNVLFWYRGRWQGLSYGSSLWLTAMLVYLLLPAIYLANGGIDGPVFLFGLVVMAYAFGVLKKSSIERWLIIAGLVLIPSGLLVVEYYQPAWVYPYSDMETRMIDLWVSYLLTLSLVIAIVAAHIRRFNLELARAKQLSAALSEQSKKDSLTGLYNHKEIFAIAREQLSRNEPIALLMLDLDYFKNINDTHGHPFGDQVLITFAQTLTAALALPVGRIGGEEFLVVVNDGDQVALQKMMQRLASAWQANELEHMPITFSAGVAVAKPTDDLESLWQRADEVLYLAKKNGRNQWQFAQ